MNSFFVNCSVNRKMYCVRCAIIGEGMLFCVSCGLLRRIAVVEPKGSLETLIRYYFQKGMASNIILGVLEANHNFKISMTSLKRKLQVMGLSKVYNVSDDLAPNYSKGNSRPFSCARLSLYVG